MNLTDVVEHFRKRGYQNASMNGSRFYISDAWTEAELYRENGQWVIEIQWDQSADTLEFDDLDEAVEYLDGEFSEE